MDIQVDIYKNNILTNTKDKRFIDLLSIYLENCVIVKKANIDPDVVANLLMKFVLMLQLLLHVKIRFMCSLCHQPSTNIYLTSYMNLKQKLIWDFDETK